MPVNKKVEQELHKIIARHDGLHGITHNVMGGKLLSEEHCANCRETAQAISTLLATQLNEARIGLLDEIKANENIQPKFMTRQVEQILVDHNTDDLGLLVQKAFLAGQNKALALVDSYRYSNPPKAQHSKGEVV